MKLLIVDDHAVVRRGTMEIISDLSPEVVFHEAGSSSEALDMIEANVYDLVLLDISLPDENGVETLKKIRLRQPDLPVLICSMYPDEEYAIKTLRVGANGYIPKSSAPEELLYAVKKVIGGGKYVSSFLSDKLLDEYLTPKRAQIPEEQLSQREYEVLYGLAHGRKLSAIADEMRVSLKTVSTYKTRAFKKLNLTNTTQLVKYAMKKGIL